MRNWMGLFLRKNNLFRCWGCPSVQNQIWALALSFLLKLLPSKLELWFFLWSFFLLRLLCISINLPYGLAWNTVVFYGLVLPSCFLELLDKLWKQIRRIVGPSFSASLEPLAHRGDVAYLNLFCRDYFGRCSSELAQLFPLPYSWGTSTRYFDRLHDFSVIIPRYYKDVYVNSLFPRKASLWNFLPIECFSLT